MKKYLILLACVGLSGCASHYSGAAASDPYGFFSGVLHGFLLPFSAIGCMMFEKVWIVGQPNTGWPYYAGFALGTSWIFSTLGGLRN